MNTSDNKFYTIAAAGVFLIAAYLCLVNLDYVALWHDEGPTAVRAKILLQQGDIIGWDGRNLVDHAMLNEDLRGVWPPLMYALTAAGFAVFGMDEIGARIVHALIGIAALGVFYLLARQHLPNHPRLVFFIFVFAAWSAQLLLYFRSSRYFSMMVLALLLLFYVYERYWQSKNPAYLPIAMIVAALAFFNHYAGGAAAMLSLAVWHILFRARATTRREWALFALCGAGVVAVGMGYLAWLGVLGGERSSFLDFASQQGAPYRGDLSALALFLWKMGAYIRELFTADWISWPVCLWFAGVMLFGWVRKADRRRCSPTQATDDDFLRRFLRLLRSGIAGCQTTDDDFPRSPVGKIILMGALFALFSAMLSGQPMWRNPNADLRYYVGALPLLLAMKGLFVEWVWRKHVVAGAAVLCVLLFSSIGAAPFNLKHFATRKATLGLHLFQFVREVHRPYRDSIAAASNYLLENAAKDDLVYVPSDENRDVLTFYAGDHVRFCCFLDENTPLPKKKIAALQAPLYLKENTPDWVIGFDWHWNVIKNQDGLVRRELVINSSRAALALAQFAARYEVVAKLDVFPYPTQRPELNAHAFSPLDAGLSGVFILRRLDE